MIVFTKPCPKCGVDVRSDEEHQCRAQKSSPAKKPTTKPVAKTEESSNSSPSMRRTVSPPPRNLTASRNVTEERNLTHCPACGQPMPEARRVQLRSYMRDYRARQKAPE